MGERCVTIPNERLDPHKRDLEIQPTSTCIVKALGVSESIEMKKESWIASRRQKRNGKMPDRLGKFYCLEGPNEGYLPLRISHRLLGISN
jgi:hypothetical protein